MKIVKRLFWMLLLTFAATSVFAEEAAKADAPGAEKTEKKDDKKFEINARIQARAVMGQSSSGYSGGKSFDTADFDFRRLRLTAKYEAAPWAGGVLDIKGENLIKLSTSAKPLTSIGAIQEANIWFKPGFAGSVIKFGQFKIPFLREQLTSSADLMVNERAYSEKALQQMDIGLLLQLKPLEILGDDWTNKLDVSFALTNGDGSGHDGIGSKFGEFIPTNTSIAKLFNWRVQINPFGGIVKDGKDHGWKDGMEVFEGNKILWSVGAAGAHTSSAETGLFSAGKAYNGYTFDTTLFAYGVYVNGEYTMFDSASYSTWQGTLGYNINLGSFSVMPLVRYNYLAMDSDGNGTVDPGEKSASIWIGADLFAIKHDLKFQIFYNIVNSGDASKNPLNKDVLYFQVQTNIGKKV
ncbi:MAG: OprO/OprP family phosphate-selective porin [Spirochaetia bacterium]|nr:OprO/OprP family phosphate-selective porin [Spirochaetia bacterium]